MENEGSFRVYILPVGNILSMAIGTDRIDYELLWSIEMGTCTGIISTQGWSPPKAFNELDGVSSKILREQSNLKIWAQACSPVRGCPHLRFSGAALLRLLRLHNDEPREVPSLS